MYIKKSDKLGQRWVRISLKLEWKESLKLDQFVYFTFVIANEQKSVCDYAS